MLRHEWKMAYTADALLVGVERKIEHHTERLNVWLGKKQETFAKIKEQGLQIDEGPLGGSYSDYPGSASNDPYRGPKVTVDQTLQAHMSAISNKINRHRRKLGDYQAWREMLKTQGKASFDLHQEDWTYFFGDLPENDE